MNIQELRQERRRKSRRQQFVDKFSFVRSREFLLAFFAILACNIFFFTSLYLAATNLRTQLKLPTARIAPLRESKKGLVLFDRNNHYLCTLHHDIDCQPVALQQVSGPMRSAILAAEDKRFYSHEGLDPAGIARALLKDFKAHKILEGGSTITQQLARNLYLRNEPRSWQKKLREAFIAWDLEQRYTKSEILQAYLNLIYFGGGVHGIERAAQHYFGKHASKLTIAESAYLAGLIRSPSVLSDARNQAEAFVRQKSVLSSMLGCGFISADDARKATTAKLDFKLAQDRVTPYPYYTNHVLTVLKRELGDQLWQRGWNVYTNLDVKAQQLAEKTLAQGVKNAPPGIDQGALVSISVKDGSVISMVGGVGDQASSSPWNRALFPHTAGSTFKPFVYLAGLTHDVVKPDTMIDDSPLLIQPKFGDKYEPKNFGGNFSGWVTARKALTSSINICAIRVAIQTGLGAVISAAHAAGIHSKLDAVPALALGCCAVSPIDMTAAYGTLARNGVYIKPSFVRKVVSVDGTIERTFAPAPSSNLEANKVAQLVDVMQDVVNIGTGSAARLDGRAIAGKTGTADQSRDIWFVGFTPDTVTAVWGGNDTNQAVPGKHVTGGEVMASIWHNYMSSYYKTHPTSKNLKFTPPEKPLLRTLPDYSYEQLLADSDGNGQIKTVPVVVSNNPDPEGGITTWLNMARARAASRTYVALSQARLKQSRRLTMVPEDQHSSKGVETDLPPEPNKTSEQTDNFEPEKPAKPKVSDLVSSGYPHEPKSLLQKSLLDKPDHSPDHSIDHQPGDNRPVDDQIGNDQMSGAQEGNDQQPAEPNEDADIRD